MSVVDNGRLEYQIIHGLIQERKSRNITQQELARRLHTKQSTISRIENMSSSPTLRFVNKMVDALEIEFLISFQPKTLKEQSSQEKSKNNSSEYICVDCSYRWQSDLNRSVIQCPQCHKRQGVLFSEYIKALKAFQDMQFEVRKSPPFRKVPPVKSLKTNAPRMMKLVLEAAGKTFPSPRLPVSLLFRVLEQSSQKSIENPPPHIKNIPSRNDLL
jgi:transcriptional regulator with XRE-family HTH domain